MLSRSNHAAGSLSWHAVQPTVHNRFRDEDGGRRGRRSKRLDRKTGRHPPYIAAAKHDTVALIEDVPERRLSRGEVGTVVEVLDPDVYEVEFSDDQGKTYAELALRRNQLVLLHNRGDKFKIVA
jgi:hypothetical protein